MLGICQQQVHGHGDDQAGGDAEEQDDASHVGIPPGMGADIT